MNILISFYNLLKTQGFATLGLLNFDTMQFCVVKMPPDIPQTGTAGLALSSKYVFVDIQHTSDGSLAYLSPPGLLVFNRNNFKLLNNYTFQLARDVHSILLSKDENTLYAVSTGTDEIIELKLEGFNVASEKVFWRLEPEGQRCDINHINSICYWQDDLYISGFGKKQGDTWGSAINGFIYNISKGEQVISDVKHPHSLTEINGHLAFCETGRGRLRFVEDERLVELSGHVRGLCTAGGNIFIATSVYRSKSKSTGKPVQLNKLKDAGCTISKISPIDLEIEKTISLNDYGSEIYDLLPVEGISSWPVHQSHEYLSLLREYRSAYEQLLFNERNFTLLQIHEVIPKGETLILVDQMSLLINNDNLLDHKYLPFLEREGKYWGPPDNDETAIAEFHRTKVQYKVNYIVFSWHCFWWLQHYSGFNIYLRTKHECVLENERLIIFKMSNT